MTGRPRLYLDEDVHYAVAVGLRRRGHDALTTIEAGRSGTTDEAQLRFAIAEDRCLFSFNRGDFALLHATFLQAGEHHPGIIISRQAAVGTVVRALTALLSRHSSDELCDQLVWLGL